MRRWLVSGVAASGLLCLAAVGMWIASSEDEADRLLREAAEALSEERFEDAMRMAREVAVRYPQRREGLALAGRGGAKLKRLPRSARFFDCDPIPDADAPVEALYAAADCLLDTGRIREAEIVLRRVLEREPQNSDANGNLAMLLRFEGRLREARPYVVELMRQGRFRRDFLTILAYSESHDIDWPHDAMYVRQCRLQAPRDQLAFLGKVNSAQTEGSRERVGNAIRAIIASDPNLQEAQARLGWFLEFDGRDEELLQWTRSLPASAEAHPQVWVTRGLFIRRMGDVRGAVHCFVEALSREPLHRQAMFHLAQALKSQGDTELADRLSARAGRLERLQGMLSEAPESISGLQQAADLAEELDCPWVALGWLHELARLHPEAPGVQERITRLKAAIDAGTAEAGTTALLLEEIALSDYPPPDWSRIEVRTSTEPISDPSATELRFVERAAAMGVEFRNNNGVDPASGRAYMFELSGGGVGVLDFDVDGWPDLYLTQGCPWPRDPLQNRDVDRLFRNVDGKSFKDVTSSAGLFENGFSQSATVADFNADGFPDVYVGNIGANSLWLNNGDGTFRDATDEAGVAGSVWTSSAAAADFNGDGLPDLYVVNYLGGNDLYTRICSQGGSPIQCSPTFFPAEQDRLYQCRGDGRFDDVTEAGGVVAPDGKGLAVVAADFDGRRRISLFVANDTTANFLFTNECEKPGGPLRFAERGLLSGLAYDGDGAAQSCMGVAAGDADGDGRIDLYVTNFTQEPNTLYLQKEAGSFVDSIRSSGIREASVPMMGWGSQFLDADLDGREDLFVANGNLYPTSPQYRMPPQCFRNLGGGRFREESGLTLGEYFRSLWLGRAAVRVDLDRDGRNDLCVTHVDSPLAILVNQTEDTGHFLAVRLRGVSAERDAIGTMVRVTAGGQTWSRQLVAGDGFAVSNERKLIFGLGTADTIDSLRVEWPSGLDQEFYDNLACDTELLIVERALRVIPLRRAIRP